MTVVHFSTFQTFLVVGISACFDNPNIITVLATNSNDEKPNWSNYGASDVDIGAPGKNIFSCLRYNDYEFKSGTSMAAPYVAGACALLLSIDPSLTATEIKNILLKTVDPIPALADYCVSGGRLNLNHAAQAALNHWIETDPWESTIERMQSNTGPDKQRKDINVEFDATDLSPGTYEADISILFSNEVIGSSRKSGTVRIPVTLTVVE